MIYLLIGTLFGFTLSMTGATNFMVLHNMFTFRSFHLYGVIAVAVIIIGISMVLLKKKLTRPYRVFHPGLIPGSVIFGIGWALSGTCPGPALIQIGELHLIAIATVAGILLGNYFYKVIHNKHFKWSEQSCDQ